MMNIRNLHENDVTKLREFVNECKPLVLNSGLSYWMLSRYFSDMCFVLEEDNRIAGFITAVVNAQNPDIMFVWQIGIANDIRRKHNSALLLDKLMEKAKILKCKYVEFTIYPDNTASIEMTNTYAKLYQLELVQIGQADFFDPVTQSQFTQNLYRITINA